MNTRYFWIILTVLATSWLSPLQAQSTDGESNFAKVLGLKSAAVVKRHFVTGRVLDDADSLPMASVQLQLQTPAESQTVTTDEDGLFQTYISGDPIDVTTQSGVHITLHRRLPGDSAAERLPDLRLTPRAPPAASPVQSDRMTVTLGGGLSGTPSVTPFSTQALPAMLPAGFSPAGGFELSGATGSGTLLWNVTQHITPPAGAQWLFLRQEDGGWRVTATQTAGTAVQTTFTDAADGAYLLALQDPGADTPAPAVGDLLVRERDALIPGAVLSHAQAVPPVVSLYQEPKTDFYLTLKPDVTPSGSRAVIELTETHVRLNAAPDVRHDSLDLYCYYTGSSLGANLQGRITVKNRTALDPNLTQSAKIRFTPTGVTPLNLNFPNDGVTSLGDLKLDFSAVMPEPLVMRLNRIPGNHLTGLEQGTILTAFSLTLGGELTGAASLSLQTAADHAEVILLRRAGAESWRYAGRLTHNGTAWVNDPNRSDLTRSGQYAVLALSEPVTEIEGRITDNGAPVQGAVASCNLMPWLSISAADGTYRTCIPRRESRLSAVNYANLRAGERTITPSAGDDHLTGQDITLGNAQFRLLSHQPKDQAWYITRLPEIALEFNLPVAVDEAAAVAALSLTSSAGSVPLRATIDGNHIYVLPNQSLEQDTQYTFTVGSALTNIYGGPLTQPASFTFHTKTQNDTPLDLTRFYLSLEGEQLYLNGPKDAIPARTYLDVLNKFTATSDSWLTQADTDFKKAVEGIPGDGISIHAVTPDGREFNHEVSLVKTGENLWRIGATPFTLEPAEGVLLRADRIQSGAGTELLIQMQTPEEALARLAATSGLENLDVAQIHQSLTFFPLDGHPMPRLSLRLETQIAATPGDHLALFSINEETVTDISGDNPRQVDLAALADFMVAPPAEGTAGKNNFSQLQMSWEFSEFQLISPNSITFCTVAPGRPMTTIIAHTSRPLNPAIPLLGPDPGSQRPWEEKLSLIGIENWQPADRIALFLSPKNGSQPIGATDHNGERKYVCTCVPQYIRGVDPFTGEVKTAFAFSGSAIPTDIYGNQHPKTETQLIHFEKEFEEQPEPLNLKMDWSLEVQDQSGQWAKDTNASADLNVGKLIRAGTGKRLALRLELPVNQSIDAPNIEIPGVSWQKQASGPNWAELTFDPALCLNPGMLELKIQLTRLEPITVWFKVYGSDPSESAAGPPRIIRDNLRKNFGVTDNILLHASESVTGWQDGISLTGPDGEVDFKLVDTSYQPLAPDEAAARVHVLVEETLQFDSLYTLVVQDLVDQDGERLDMTPPGQPPANLPFRKKFITEKLPHRVPLAEGNVRREQVAYNNLIVVASFQYVQDQYRTTLEVHDTRTPDEPNLLYESTENMTAPYMLNRRMTLMTPEMLNGRMLVDTSKPIDDLPLHTALIEVGLGPGGNALMRILFYQGKGQWSSMGSFNLIAAGFPTSIDAMGPYAAVSFVDFFSELGGVTVYDMNFLLRRLIVKEATLISGTAPSPGSYPENRPRLQFQNRTDESDENELDGEPIPNNNMTYRDSITDLSQKFPHKFTSIVSPNNSRESVFAFVQHGDTYRPALAMAGKVFPGMWDFEPGSLQDLKLTSHPEVDFIDRRLMAKTKWTQDIPRWIHAKVLEDFHFTNPATGPGQPAVLIKDLAVFGMLGLNTNKSYIEVYDFPETALDFGQFYEPRLVLEMGDSNLKDMALSQNGILALVNRDGELSLLDLKVMLSSIEPGSETYKLKSTDYLNNDPLGMGIEEITFSNGRLITLENNRTAVGYYPLAYPKAWRDMGWEWYDLAEWRDQDTTSPPELTLKTSRHIVLYATDRILNPTDTDPHFLMEQGSFAIPTFEGEQVTWRIVDENNKPIGPTMTRKKAEGNTTHYFATSGLRDHFKNQEAQKVLRQKGFLTFKVIYEITEDDIRVDYDELPFVVAYRYDDTRYEDPYRELDGIDMLSCRPQQGAVDHGVSKADGRLNLDTARIISGDYLFEASAFGVGMADTRVPIAALPTWWDISRMGPGQHNAEDLHPRLMLEQPGAWRIEGKLNANGSAVTVLNDPLTMLNKTEDGWSLNHRQSMTWLLETRRDFPKIKSWFETLNSQAAAGEGDPAERMHYPLIRFRPQRNEPAALHGPLKVYTQDHNLYDNQMQFNDGADASAYPKSILELVGDEGSYREAIRDYVAKDAGRVVSQVAYSDDGMVLAYTYDQAGYLVSVTQNDKRETTYEWEPVSGLKLGDLTLKRLKRMARGDWFTEYQYDDPNSLAVTGITTPYGTQTLTATGSGNGLPNTVTLSGVGGAPDQSVAFAQAAGAHLTSRFEPGPHDLTWERRTAGEASLPLVVADSFNDQTFGYDKDKLLLTAHGRLGGAQSWTYGNADALVETPIDFTDALGNHFTIHTTAQSQTISAPGGEITTYYSGSGAPIAQTGLDGFTVGAPDSMFYLPVGAGYEVDGGYPVRVPIPGNPDIARSEVYYNQFGDPIQTVEMGLKTEYAAHDDLGRPRLILYPEGRSQSIEYQYDAEQGRRIITSTEGNGRQTVTAYDPRGLPVSTSILDKGEGTTTLMSYDSLARLIQAQESGKTVYSATYSGTNDRPDEEAFADGSKIKYTLGNQFTTTIEQAKYHLGELSRELNLSTNALGRTTGGRIQGRGAALFQHDAFGRLTTIDAPGGPVTMGYNQATVSVNDGKTGVKQTMTQHDPAGLVMDYSLQLDDGAGKTTQETNRSVVTQIQSSEGGGPLLFEQTVTGGPVPAKRLVSSTGYNLGGSYGAFDMIAGGVDGWGKPTSFTGDQTLELTYDDHDRLSSFKEPDNNPTSFSYDHLDRINQFTDSLEKTATIDWIEGENRPGSIQVSDGIDSLTLYQADTPTTAAAEGFFGATYQQNTQSLGQSYQLTKTHAQPTPSGKTQAVSNLTLDPDTGLPTSYTNFVGDTYSWSYANKDRDITLNYPSKGQATVQLDGLGRLISLTDRKKRDYNATYDEHGRIQTLSAQSRTYHFNYAGELLSSVTGGKRDLAFEQFDHAGRPQRIRDGSRQTIDVTYRANGEVHTAKLARNGGLSTQLTFDTHGDLTELDRIGRYKLSFKPGKWGGPETVTYLGTETQILGGDKHVWHLPASTTIHVDDEGRLESLVRDGLAAITVTRDEEGRPLLIAHGSTETAYTYDGDMVASVKVTSPTHSDTTMVATNDDGQTTQVTNELDGTNQATYESETAKAGISNPNTGRMSTYTDPNGTVYHYSYSLDGDVTALSIDGMVIFAMDYDAGGNLTGSHVGSFGTTWSNYGDGLPAEMRWSSLAEPLIITKNQDGRLTDITGEDFHLGLEWQADDQAVITQVVREAPDLSETWTPTYSEDHKLTGITMARQAGGVDLTIQEDYRRVVNQNTTTEGIFRAINGVEALSQTNQRDESANNLRLSKLGFDGAPDTDLTYDDVGNLTRITYSNGATQDFSYDGERRIRKIVTTRNGVTHTEEYRYDYLKRRIETRRNGESVSTVYAWHGSRVVAIGEKEQGAVTWTHAIGHGPFGPTYILDLKEGVHNYHIMTDHLGTPYAYRDAATGAVYYTPHNPWGEPMQTVAGGEPPYREAGEAPSNNGTQPPDSVFASVPLGLGGHLYDVGTGLVYMHNRYYHPRLGHFLTADFRAPDIYDPTTFTEPYEYAAGNPVLFMDPNGLNPDSLPFPHRAGDFNSLTEYRIALYYFLAYRGPVAVQKYGSQPGLYWNFNPDNGLFTYISTPLELDYQLDILRLIINQDLSSPNVTPKDYQALYDKLTAIKDEYIESRKGISFFNQQSIIYTNRFAIDDSFWWGKRNIISQPNAPALWEPEISNVAGQANAYRVYQVAEGMVIAAGSGVRTNRNTAPGIIPRDNVWETHLKTRLQDAISQTYAKLTKGLSNNQIRKNIGPVLAGVMDTNTGSIFIGLNSKGGELPNNLHPLVAERIALAQKIPYNKTHGAGSHAEIHALNNALNARTGSQISEMLIFTINSGQKGSAKNFGLPVPRCPHCRLISDGAQFIPTGFEYR